jgi:hypothetical protein
LADHNLGRIIGCRQIITARRQHANATPLQDKDAHFLHQHLTREPARILNDDGPDAIAFNPVKHGSEAGTVLYQVSTRNRFINILVNQPEACRLGIKLDGRTLPNGTVFAVTDISGARCPQIGNRFDELFRQFRCPISGLLFIPFRFLEIR